MTYYLIYIMFRNGHEGYFTEVDDRTVRWTDTEPGEYTYDPYYVKNHYYTAPTYERALSKAKWLCKEFRSIVGRTEIIKWRE